MKVDLLRFRSLLATQLNSLLVKSDDMERHIIYKRIRERARITIEKMVVGSRGRLGTYGTVEFLPSGCPPDKRGTEISDSGTDN